MEINLNQFEINLNLKINQTMSNGDFSWICANINTKGFSFFLLATKIYRTGSVSGLSKNSIICYSVCLVFRNFALL